MVSLLDLVSPVFVVSIAGYVFVLVQLFKRKGFLYGLLGLLLFPYAVYWGWAEWDAKARQPVMMIWSLALVLMIGVVGLMALVLHGLQR